LLYNLYVFLNKLKTAYENVISDFRKFSQTVSKVLMSVDMLKYVNPNKL